MNFGFKTKVFNVLTTPNVTPAVDIESTLEPGARVLGILCTGGTTATGAGTAQAVLFIEGATIPTQVANINVTTIDTQQTWWSGVDGRYKDSGAVPVNAAANTYNGFWPRCMPGKWYDALGLGQWVTKIQIQTTGFGQCLVFYTVDQLCPSGMIA